MYVRNIYIYIYIYVEQRNSSNKPYCIVFIFLHMQDNNMHTVNDKRFHGSHRFSMNHESFSYKCSVEQ